MVTPSQFDSKRLSKSQRILLVLVGGSLLVLLAVAALVAPDDRGFGTHQRLGLPPCTFRVVTGIRCPSCGMTTSWAHLMRGNVIASLKSNTGGTLAGIIALVLAPWAFFSGVRGRWLGRPLDDRMALIVTIAVILVALADWAVRFFVGS
jgi:hypothetical protein